MEKIDYENMIDIGAMFEKVAFEAFEVLVKGLISKDQAREILNKNNLSVRVKFEKIIEEGKKYE